MSLRISLFFLLLGCIRCGKELAEESLPNTYEYECIAIEDTLTFQKFSSLKDSSFILVNAPIDSINQLIINENIIPLEKKLADGKWQLWWHKGHPIKLNSNSHWFSAEREMQTTFYIFDNCNGASEFHKYDTLTPKNLITNHLFFYENREAKHLFVEAMTPNGRTHLYQNINHAKYAQDGAISRLKLFESIIERYDRSY